jgi:hypothetical protein
VLETLSPPAAIICAVDYGEPITVEELTRHGLSRRAAQAIIDRSGHHEEREYVLDRQRLGIVTVARRYAQADQIAARRPPRAAQAVALGAFCRRPARDGTAAPLGDQSLDQGRARCMAVNFAKLARSATV